MIDRYGQILIRVVEDSMGNILLSPVSERRQREVSKSNLYNGAYDVYIDSWHVEQFMIDFPSSTYVNHNGERVINNGVKILIDSWTYRHMVGGQID